MVGGLQSLVRHFFWALLLASIVCSPVLPYITHAQENDAETNGTSNASEADESVNKIRRFSKSLRQFVDSELDVNMPRRWADFTKTELALLNQLKAQMLAINTDLKQLYVDDYKLWENLNDLPLEERFRRLEKIQHQLSDIRASATAFREELDKRRVQQKPSQLAKLNVMAVASDLQSFMFKLSGDVKSDPQRYRFIESTNSFLAQIGHLPLLIELFLLRIGAYRSLAPTFITELLSADAYRKPSDAKEPHLHFVRFKAELTRLSENPTLSRSDRNRCVALIRILNQHWGVIVDLAVNDSATELTEHTRDLLRSQPANSRERIMLQSFNRAKRGRVLWRHFRSGLNFTIAKLGAVFFASSGWLPWIHDPKALDQYLAQFNSIYSMGGFFFSLTMFGYIHQGSDWLLFRNFLANSIWGERVLSASQAWNMRLNQHQVLRYYQAPEMRAQQAQHLKTRAPLTKTTFLLAALHHALPLALTMTSMELIFGVLQHPQRSEFLFLVKYGFLEEAMQMLSHAWSQLGNKMTLIRTGSVATYFTIAHILVYGTNALLHLAIPTLPAMPAMLGGVFVFMLVLIVEMSLSHHTVVPMAERHMIAKQVESATNLYQRTVRQILYKPWRFRLQMMAMARELEQRLAEDKIDVNLAEVIQAHTGDFTYRLVNHEVPEFLSTHLDDALAPNQPGNPTLSVQIYLGSRTYQDFSIIMSSLQSRLYLLTSGNLQKAVPFNLAFDHHRRDYPATTLFLENYIVPLIVAPALLTGNSTGYAEYILGRITRLEQQLAATQRKQIQQANSHFSEIERFISDENQLLRGLWHIYHGNVDPHSSMQVSYPEALLYLQGKHPDRFNRNKAFKLSENPRDLFEATDLYDILANDKARFYQIRRLVEANPTGYPTMSETKGVADLQQILLKHLASSTTEYIDPVLSKLIEEQKQSITASLLEWKESYGQEERYFVERMLQSDICLQTRRRTIGVEDVDGNFVHFLNDHCDSVLNLNPPDEEIVHISEGVGWFFTPKWIDAAQHRLAINWALAHKIIPETASTTITKYRFQGVKESDIVITAIEEIAQALTKINRRQLHEAYVAFLKRSHQLLEKTEEGNEEKAVKEKVKAAEMFLETHLAQVDPLRLSHWLNRYRQQPEQPSIDEEGG